MEIQKQQKLADEIYELLYPHMPKDSILLGGGAPRDWYMGKEANDLDFFLFDEEALELKDVSEILGVEFYRLVAEKYGDEFNKMGVYEAEYKGQTIQFIWRNQAPLETVKSFPVNMSQAWYIDGEVFATDLFEIGVRYKELLFSAGVLGERYLDKLDNKFPPLRGWRSHVHVRAMLLSIGNPRRADWVVPIDGVNLVPEVVGANNNWILDDIEAGIDV